MSTAFMVSSFSEWKLHQSNLGTIDSFTNICTNSIDVLWLIRSIKNSCEQHKQGKLVHQIPNWNVGALESNWNSGTSDFYLECWCIRFQQECWCIRFLPGMLVNQNPTWNAGASDFYLECWCIRYQLECWCIRFQLECWCIKFLPGMMVHQIPPGMLVHQISTWNVGATDTNWNDGAWDSNWNVLHHITSEMLFQHIPNWNVIIRFVQKFNACMK